MEGLQRGRPSGEFAQGKHECGSFADRSIVCCAGSACRRLRWSGRLNGHSPGHPLRLRHHHRHLSSPSLHLHPQRPDLSILHIKPSIIMHIVFKQVSTIAMHYSVTLLALSPSSISLPLVPLRCLPPLLLELSSRALRRSSFSAFSRSTTSRTLAGGTVNASMPRWRQNAEMTWDEERRCERQARKSVQCSNRSSREGGRKDGL